MAGSAVGRVMVDIGMRIFEKPVLRWVCFFL